MTIDEIWSDRYLVKLERLLWLAIMEAQRTYNPGLVSKAQIRDSRAMIDEIDLQSIDDREMVTKHDLKARLDEFVALSGHSRIHLGMTSADIVENTYLIRQKASVKALGPQYVRAAQPWMAGTPFRGVRGPIGSDVDMLSLLGSREAVESMNLELANRFGFDEVINAVPQCMPRSFDFQLASLLLPMVEDPISRALATGLLSILSQQDYWLEGDVSSSCVRRYAWPMWFKILTGDYEEAICLN